MAEPHSLQLDYRDDCLIIRVRGRDIIEKMEATVQAIAAAIMARPVRATLVDLRAVPGPLYFMDRFSLGKFAGQYFVRFKVAALVHEEQADPERIGQVVAKNRGTQIEVFTDPTAAEAWLKKQSAPKPGPG